MKYIGYLFLISAVAGLMVNNIASIFVEVADTLENIGFYLYTLTLTAIGGVLVIIAKLEEIRKELKKKK